MHIGLAGKLSQARASRKLTNAHASSVGHNRGSCMKILNGIPYFLAPLVTLVGYVLNSHSLMFKVLQISESPIDILEIPSKCLRLPISSDLARLINFCRSEGRLAGELARFVVDLEASRKRAFAKLTVRDLFPEST